MGTDEVASAIRSAVTDRRADRLAPVLADDAQWGQCVGRDVVVRWLGSALGEVELVDLTAHDDRLILELRLGGNELSQVAFVTDGLITEIVDADDRADALDQRPTPNPTPPSGPPTGMNEVAAILPVRDLGPALEHYQRLGFEVNAYDGADFYGFARRGAVWLHFTVDHDPARSAGAAYLYVDDADALYAEWRNSGVFGHFHEPEDTDYGLREGAHVDLDGNLLRFGSPLPSRQDVFQNRSGD